MCMEGYYGINCGKRTALLVSKENPAPDTVCAGRKANLQEHALVKVGGLVQVARVSLLLGCSKRGECVNGACICKTGWTGPGCEVACPLTNGLMCSGHGRCDNGTCDCDTYKSGGKVLGGYYGEQTCHLAYCGAHNNMTLGCSGNGECVGKQCVQEGIFGGVLR